MASISFNDGTALVLDNGLTSVASGVGSRFANWVPITVPYGPSRDALGTGQRYMFKFRTDYGASFEIREIPIANAYIADRLRTHLLNGGTCAVTTGDSSSRTYATCGLMPGTTPEISQQNPNDITFSMRLSLIDLSASPQQMRCEYTAT